MRPAAIGGTLKRQRAARSTEEPGASGAGSSTRNVVPYRVRFTSRPPIVIDSSFGALLNPWQEKSKVVPRKTSGGWLSWFVTPLGSHRFCSTNSQRYVSVSGERFE